MAPSSRDIVVAGHICLDVIPAFDNEPDAPRALLAPGKLVQVGPPVTAPGGAVSNTGLALRRLGFSPRLVGKIGDDLFGKALLEVLSKEDAALAENMTTAPGASTSYTIVVSPPGTDRAFLHCPGANDTFGAKDVPDSLLQEAGLFHFGYPPLMRRMRVGGGSEMAALFERARASGAVTSLDMAFPDPDSEAAQVDWADWLQNVLPHVDVFAPSLEEMRAMLGRPQKDASALEDPAELSDLAGELLGMGAGLVALKLGSEGLYLRAASDAERLPAGWAGRELLAPCFEVEVAGTTGAGDCTVAGLLVGLAAGTSPEEALATATAVGACSVEEPDSTSGIPSLEAVRRRIARGWERRAPQTALPDGWRWDDDRTLWHGPRDRTG